MLWTAVTVAIASIGLEEKLDGMPIEQLMYGERDEFAVLVTVSATPEEILTFFPDGNARGGERVLVEVVESWGGEVATSQLYVVSDPESGLVGVGQSYLLFVTPRVGGANYSNLRGSVVPFADWEQADDTVVLSRRGNSFRVQDNRLYTSTSNTPICVESDSITFCTEPDPIDDLTTKLGATAKVHMNGVQ
jgi:hypothetical protein